MVHVMLKKILIYISRLKMIHICPSRIIVYNLYYFMKRISHRIHRKNVIFRYLLSSWLYKKRSIISHNNANWHQIVKHAKRVGFTKNWFWIARSTYNGVHPPINIENIKIICRSKWTSRRLIFDRWLVLDMFPVIDIDGWTRRDDKRTLTYIEILMSKKTIDGNTTISINLYVSTHRTATQYYKKTIRCRFFT